ncbi:hypothetical protein [Nitrosopumilus sp.]|uniref:hypothetical protein n=1 Tax=Nitrosopumilus sp. TaxID=2024843 RepID=UPI003B5A61E8
MIESTTKIQVSKHRHTIYIPKEIHSDSAFPFRVDDILSIKISGKKLIIEKV